MSNKKFQVLEHGYDYDYENENRELRLPIHKNELGKFITGLLGQPQSQSQKTKMNVDIDHDWIIDMHNIIEQRIFQQASADRVSFTAAIYFENNKKRTLNKYEEFYSYKETNKLASVGIRIIWTYLVAFPKDPMEEAEEAEKPVKEKQQITFSAMLNSSRLKDEDESELIGFFEEYIIGNVKKSTISYKIEHTKRTWGDDIESKINDCIDNVERKENPLAPVYNFLRLMFIMFFFLSSIIIPELLDTHINQSIKC